MRSSCAGISFSCNHPPDPDVGRCMTCWLFLMPLHRPIGSQEVQAWICVPNICKAEPWPFLRTKRRSTLKRRFISPNKCTPIKLLLLTGKFVCRVNPRPAGSLYRSRHRVRYNMGSETQANPAGPGPIIPVPSTRNLNVFHNHAHPAIITRSVANASLGRGPHFHLVQPQLMRARNSSHNTVRPAKCQESYSHSFTSDDPGSQSTAPILRQTLRQQFDPTQIPQAIAAGMAPRRDDPA